MGRYFPLRQPQGQRQRSLCGTGADQGTVRAGDKELLDIDGIAPGSAKVDRAHRADFIAACGPGNAVTLTAMSEPEAAAAPSAIRLPPGGHHHCILR